MLALNISAASAATKAEVCNTAREKVLRNNVSLIAAGGHLFLMVEMTKGTPLEEISDEALGAVNKAMQDNPDFFDELTELCEDNELKRFGDIGVLWGLPAKYITRVTRDRVQSLVTEIS